MGPDIITLPLEVGVTWSPSSARVLSRVWGPYDVLVLGPGLGREPMTTEFIKELLLLRRKERPGLRAVFDADALFHLAEDTELLSPETLLPGDVLTPHPGEMARLLDSSISQVQKDRPGACRKLAAASGAVAVLKGAGTLVSAGGQDHGPLYLEASACPALAVGGSGDVLSGVIGALLARGLTSLEAACLGVHWHGLAGRLLAHEHPRRGNLPQEIAAALPKAGAVLFGDRENHGP
jgi:NAD(P)H-hydrate epimerase